MQLRKIQNKKAAIELSIGTIVIIVIAMTMLIMGVVLVRNIFSGATTSVDSLNDKVRAEITNLFTEESSKVAIRLGSDKLAKVKQGDKIGIGIGGKTEPAPGATQVSASQRQLKYTVEKTSTTDCTGITIEGLSFAPGSKITSPVAFDDEEGPDGVSILFFQVADDAPACTQKYKVHTYDVDHPYPNNEIASASFRLEVVPNGIFG